MPPEYLSYLASPHANVKCVECHIGRATLAPQFFRQAQEVKQQEEQMRALATEAELRALKAQLNPHFLFNTLNTVAELIHTDSERAEATVERLAEMFRYVLNGSERGLVPLPVFG